MRRRGVLFVAVFFWAAGSLGGFAYILNYSSRPASLEAAAESWPSRARQARRTDGFDLVMAVHPRCPCTRASVAELNKLLQRWGGKVQAHILVYKPFEVSDLWADSDITRRLKELPYATVSRDLDGSQAAEFGLSASGQVLLYDRQGKLVFDGGLTAFRGHEGASLGQQELLDLVAGRSRARAGSKVFGCSLKDKTCKYHPDAAALPRQGG